jgi:predicted SAM-dependent methyltransferase
MKNTIINEAILHDYLSTKESKKLHIGCGSNLLDEWLNADYNVDSSSVFNLDASKIFPINSDLFDFIFSEHMIEHLNYYQGLSMLNECRRILKPGGRIRISTPDLGFLISLYAQNKSKLQLNYINWASSNFIKNNVFTDTMIINNFVRDWGHLFIYDLKTITHSLEMVGFINVESFLLNESNFPELCNLENEKRMPDGFLQLESFTVEAQKPL